MKHKTLVMGASTILSRYSNIAIKRLLENNFELARVEGKNSNSWILIDAKDIIINVFTKEEREYYNLEKMLVEDKKKETFIKIVLPLVVAENERILG